MNYIVIHFIFLLLALTMSIGYIIAYFLKRKASFWKLALPWLMAAFWCLQNLKATDRYKKLENHIILHDNLRKKQLEEDQCKEDTGIILRT